MFQVRMLTIGVSLLLLGACGKKGEGFDSAGRCLVPTSGPFSKKTSRLSEAEREKAVALLAAHHSAGQRFSPLIVDTQGGFNPYSDSLITRVKHEISEGNCTGVDDKDEISPTRAGGFSVSGTSCPIEFRLHTLPLVYTHGISYSRATEEYTVRFHDRELATSEVIAIQLKGDIVGLNRIDSDNTVSSGCVELEGEIETKTLGTFATSSRYTSYMASPQGQRALAEGELPRPTLVEGRYQRSYDMGGRLVVFELTFGITSPSQPLRLTLNGEPATASELQALGGIDSLPDRMKNL